MFEKYIRHTQPKMRIETVIPEKKEITDSPIDENPIEPVKYLDCIVTVEIREYNRTVKKEIRLNLQNLIISDAKQLTHDYENMYQIIAKANENQRKQLNLFTEQDIINWTIMKKITSDCYLFTSMFCDLEFVFHQEKFTARTFHDFVGKLTYNANHKLLCDFTINILYSYGH